jgi:hypothetical protein
MHWLACHCVPASTRNGSGAPPHPPLGKDTEQGRLANTEDERAVGLKGPRSQGEDAELSGLGGVQALSTVKVGSAVFLITTTARPLNVFYYIILLNSDLLTIRRHYLNKSIFCFGTALRYQ